MQIVLDPSSPESYATFLRIKQLPIYRIEGRLASFPDEYAGLVGIGRRRKTRTNYKAPSWHYDYQASITEMAIRKQRFAVFMECGYGKTCVLLEFARHAHEVTRKPIMIVCPLMVIKQTMSEAVRFYNSTLPIQQIYASDLPRWMRDGDGIGITNYEALTDDLDQGNLGGIVADESSCMKSHYGKWGTKLIELGRGLQWKLALTGTPAPNDRIEYANHAIFLDRFPTVNAFLARYFVNRGQTDNRWELKPHALEPFYRDLSDWSVFLTNPATYGWKDNASNIPPIHVHIHDVEMTSEQREAVTRENGDLFGTPGGITSRSRLAQIAKGNCAGKKIETRKPEFIRDLIQSWPTESTLVWCLYNHEQESIERVLPDAASISGDTPMEEREIIIDWFKGLICTCERQRRIANICKRITGRTNTNGEGLRKNKRNTTEGDGRNTLLTNQEESRQEKQSKNGKIRIQKSDSASDSKHTELRLKNTEACWISSADGAPCVDASDLGTADQNECTSTTATSQELFADCCAGNATKELVFSENLQNCSKKQPCICEIGKPKGRVLISKPRVLGYGLNLQIATRQVFSGLQDSYESFHQAVKRSNRIGSSLPLNVHIPVTDVERPMIETVLRKAKRVQQDTEEQERLFKEFSLAI